MRIKFGGFAAFLVLSALLAHEAVASGKVLILDYHSFLGTTSSLDWKLEDFGAQLDKMRSLGFKLVSLNDAMADNIEGDNNIAITIDDGNHSIWQAVQAVLLPKAVPTELFIYPAVIGHESHFLTREQLVSLAGEGFGIGAHGYHHMPMSAIAWQRDRKTVMAEATRPADLLKFILGARPSFFAYPYGVVGPDAKDLVKQNGYDWAFLASEKFVFVDPADPALDHWAVPRTIVYHWNRGALFRFLEKKAPVKG
ncbi:MAG TPA: polysaccharide deacetylase family protein [Rectinemataceae bacterium]|nr:polysaccharide deacetylase family protein [Rectinemataceae bacterium]